MTYQIISHYCDCIAAFILFAESELYLIESKRYNMKFGLLVMWNDSIQYLTLSCLNDSSELSIYLPAPNDPAIPDFHFW